MAFTGCLGMGFSSYPLSCCSDMANFDRVAPFYDLLAFMVFGRSVRQSQCCFLDKLPKKGHVLVMGGGTGWLLEEMTSRRPQLSIDYIEASKKMIRKSTKRRVGDAQIQFIHGTEKEIPSDKKYDAVITHFFLDVFPASQLFGVMELLDKALSTGGLWFCADFQKTSKSFHLYLLRLMHWFFRKTAKMESRRLQDFHAHFKALGYQVMVERSFYNQMISSKVYKKCSKTEAKS